MTHHETNPNLKLYYGDHFQGLPIQANKGPFFEQCLERLHQTIERSLDAYPRVFAFRFDLRLPPNEVLPFFAYSNQVIDRFNESFKAKVKHNRCKAKRKNPHAHDTKVRIFWVREFGQFGRPHYHCAMLLNRDAFHMLGQYKSDANNIFSRIVEAWASALGMPVDHVAGLVQVPDNPIYHLDRGEPYGVAQFFYRTSYLCKTATKFFGDGGHCFGYRKT
jgi:hypothetical protein